MDRISRIFAAALAAILAVSCVDDFAPDLKDAPDPELVIDGLLTTEPAAHLVRLSKSAPFGTPSSEIPVEEKSSTGVAQAEEMVKAVDQQQPLPTVLPAGGIADRVLLGKTKDGREIFWEFGHPKLNNRHFLIFGNSGMGKTYAIQAILCELGRKGQNSLIIDYIH